MSKRLAPFTLVLAYPPSHQDSASVTITNKLVQPIRNSMDLATNPVLKAFVAGSVSGTCSTVLFQPLDLVKTRIQNASAAAASASAQPQPRVGMLSVVQQVLKTENLSGLWRGIVPSVTRTVPGVGLYFSSLHWLKTHVNHGAEPSSPGQAVLLGMAARSLAGCVMIPITVLKTRFESGAYNYQRMSQALAQIYRTEGLRGLSCGLAPTLIRDAPFSGLYLMFYTQLKQKVVLPCLAATSSAPPNGASSSAAHFSCGLVAGSLASLITHPADVVKTKMQLYPAEYRSVRQSVLLVLRSPLGARGFLVGLAPRMLRRTLMSALAWTVYEEIMRKIGLK